MRTAILCMLIVMVIVVAGCGFSEYKAKEEAHSKALFHAIMESESTIPGTKMVDALSIVLVASGKYVKVIGWDSKKNVKDGSYDVWLNLTVNDNTEKLHWVVDENNNLHPADDLSQKVSVKQKLKL